MSILCGKSKCYLICTFLYFNMSPKKLFFKKMCSASSSEKGCSAQGGTGLRPPAWACRGSISGGYLHRPSGTDRHPVGPPHQAVHVHLTWPGSWGRGLQRDPETQLCLQGSVPGPIPESRVRWSLHNSTPTCLRSRVLTAAPELRCAESP